MDERQTDTKDAQTQADLNHIDLNQEITGLQAEASSEESGRKSKMLVKHTEIRIVLIAMRAGSRWEDQDECSNIPSRSARGDIRFHTANGAFDLRPGQLITLAPGVVHSVDAVEESAFLLTLS